MAFRIALLGLGVLVLVAAGCSGSSAIEEEESQSGGRAGSGTSGAGGTSAGGSGGEAGSDVPDDRWQDCPTAADYAGDESWPNLVEVTEAATYCATFNGGGTLEEVLAKKALLRIAPGTYRLPSSGRPGLGLPVCVAYGSDGNGVGLSPVGVEYSSTPVAGDVNHRYDFEATAPDPERTFSIVLERRQPAATAFSFTLDGSENRSSEFDPHAFSFYLCQSTEATCRIDRVFDSCTHASSTLNRHEITLGDGDLVLDVRIGVSPAGTEPAAFVRAAGTFRGQSFEQTDYFRLIYLPGHHHFSRHFAVLFDEPIEGACGLEIADFWTGGETTPNAYAVDCALARLETLTVVAFSLTRDP